MNRASLEKRPDDVARMFDDVAARYDLVNDVLSAGQVRYWRRIVVAAVDAHRGQRVLDLAAGTGTSSEPYADAGVDVVAADFSPGMLEVGRRRRPDITFVQADATALPFGDDEFDATTISYGLRNVNDPRQALREMLRVTKPGGRLVVAEFSRPTFAPFRTVYTEYLMRAIPPIARAVASNPDSYVYLAESIRAWPDQDQLAGWLVEAGWTDVQYRNLTGGIVAVHRAIRPTVTAAGTVDTSAVDTGSVTTPSS
ncbi:bifunctional demethylmenaquinone methyltransferase/2-methoxy-6-polyprenyl-1,4-benzoquinol methylase [Tersicoccus phoenicis]|uniref:Demethylmenaquinone methyltransferase n=1 Tax=Tersicoccus phoenicis TaxID=554083 RepID=A0A1R1LP50_9MICC|nr:demethylmenaquinone methyltransferase [Tersicoccus phoenicis]OMH29282.1 bifunctional demethylmenaquinone methyltransferase/2-methoxy-6-polyprenyl-1,4-benzoquinol methylase [Tersicoccus phoenicis]